MQSGNPQVENGYIRIATELWEALVNYRIPGEQRQVLDFIIRKTYGWKKKEDAISITQFEKATGLPRKNICRALSELCRKRVVSGKKATTKVTRYCINKKYKQWERETVKRGSGKKATGVVAKKPPEVVAKKPPTIDNKDTRTIDKKSKAFSLPSQEEINEASKKKITNELETVCEEIYQAGYFKKVHAFVNMMRKQKKNDRAILHTLTRCYLKGQIKKFNGNEAWAYCTKIIQVENGNFNEREHQKNKAGIS